MIASPRFMPPRYYRPRILLAGAVCLLIAVLSTVATAGDATEEDEVDFLVRRLDAAEQRIRSLESERGAVNAAYAPSSNGGNANGIEPVDYRSTTVFNAAPSYEMPSYFADYDGGFLIRPYDKSKDPFELKINGRLQFRHVGFSRDRRTYTNRGGTVSIDDRNDFEIERGRLELSGFILDPNLQYYLNFDGDTDDNHRAVFHDFWFNYKFSDSFNLHLGKAFVPGSRAWVDGSTRTHLADRSLSTTFFRPDRSVGIWATGEMAEDWYYRAMISNGYTASDLRSLQIDTNFAYSGSMWWEPLGEFGKGYADLKQHDDPVVRVGQSFTFASQHGTDSSGIPRSEQNFIRISDGTRLITPGALAAGVTVTGADIFMYAIDAATKYRGFSFNSEYYFRWLNQFDTAGGPIPFTELYTDGFYTDIGYMLIEKSLEVVGRISTVDGLFGDSWEYAGGVNWYVNGTHKNKVTFDVSLLDGSPASNSGPNYIVGQDGVLTRLQWQIAF